MAALLLCVGCWYKWSGVGAMCFMVWEWKWPFSGSGLLCFFPPDGYCVYDWVNAKILQYFPYVIRWKTCFSSASVWVFVNYYCFPLRYNAAGGFNLVFSFVSLSSVLNAFLTIAKVSIKIRFSNCLIILLIRIKGVNNQLFTRVNYSF